MNPFYKFTPLVLFGYGLFWLTRDFRVEGLPAGVLWLLLWGLLAKAASRLKGVYLAGDVLYVSNYLRRVRIPLTEVAAVEASSLWGWQPRTVAVELRNGSEFGKRFIFIPKGIGFMAAEVAEELNAAVAAQHNDGTHPTRDTRNVM